MKLGYWYKFGSMKDVCDFVPLAPQNGRVASFFENRPFKVESVDDDAVYTVKFLDDAGHETEICLADICPELAPTWCLFGRKEYKFFKLVDAPNVVKVDESPVELFSVLTVERNQHCNCVIRLKDVSMAECEDFMKAWLRNNEFDTVHIIKGISTHRAQLELSIITTDF